MSDGDQLDATINAHAAVAGAVDFNLVGNAGPQAGATLPQVVLPIILRCVE